MTDPAEQRSRFAAMHKRTPEQQPLLLANAWDAGSARLLESLGFEALATTSSGHAASLGRLDYGVGRDDTLAHAASIVAATSLPVSADLEDCFAPGTPGVEETIGLARQAGLAGCSIEDWSSERERLYEIGEAVERVAAAAQAAHAGPAALVLSARAENFLRGNPDIEDTIARLTAYEAAGADVLYAPGVHEPSQLRELLAAVHRPVNVLLRPGAPTVAELGALGVKRISVGGAFAFAAYGAAARAARELLEQGTHDFLELSGSGAKTVRTAFGA